jgi:hypothetical protein
VQVEGRTVGHARILVEESSSRIVFYQDQAKL